MSRGEFRGLVSAPRPGSAWLMVSVASAALWITGQIEIWVMAIQSLAYGVSYWTRLAPARWQRGPGFDRDERHMADRASQLPANAK